MFNSEEIMEFSGLPNLRHPNNIVDSDKIIFCQPDSEKVDGRPDNVNLHIDINALENLVENMISTCEAKKNIKTEKLK
jgi:hypothetical protein